MLARPLLWAVPAVIGACALVLVASTTLGPETGYRALLFHTIAIGFGAGFYEVFTDGFHGRAVPELLGIPTSGHALSRHVETLNALDRDYSLLKNNALGQAVQAVGQNLRNKTGDVKLYEWTRTFHPSSGADRAAALRSNISAVRNREANRSHGLR